MPPIIIRIFASHPIALCEFTHLLASSRDFQLLSEEGRFDVGVFDGEMHSLDTTVTATRLRHPKMRPLLVSLSADANECLRWLFRGIWGLVAYERYKEDLPHAVRHVAEGQLWFPQAVVARWMQIDVARRASAQDVKLTRREREVWEFLTRRLSNKEIADILEISERTVKFHVSNLLTKMNVNSRQQLVTPWVRRSELL